MAHHGRTLEHHNRPSLRPQHRRSTHFNQQHHKSLRHQFGQQQVTARRARIAIMMRGVPLATFLHAPARARAHVVSNVLGTHPREGYFRPGVR